MNVTPDYGNWVPKKLIYGPGAIGLVCLIAAAWFLPLALLAAVCLLIARYFAYARNMFAVRGGDVQAQIVDMSKAACIARALKLPFMVGPMAVIAGEK